MNDRRKTNAYRDDEISLVDLWWVLVKHKKWVFFVWLLISLTGAVIAVLIPERFAYTTLIEIGHLIDETGKDNLVETADEARLRLTAGIIPVTEKRFLGEGNEAYDLKVKVPEKNASFLLLESRGLARLAPGHFALQGAVAEALRQEHQTVFLNKAREQFGAKQEAVKRTIASLQNGRGLLAARLKHLDAEETYLKKQIEHYRTTIASAIRLGEKTVGQTADDVAALAYIIMTSQIEQQQRSQATLEERLVLDMPKERGEIRKAIAEYVRAVEEQRIALNIIVSGLERMRETRVVIPPTQSVSPVVTKGRGVIILAILGGLMLGVLGAFFAEFFLKARKEAGMVRS
ncbi:MAG: Wzz/FepE/Etk N-terminal domain-containing protein, partial [Sulfuricaulis sp.]|nr:Wzz/FepE/Etk N-terminal domain-containing protein [Sulfuricaulis sp.]